MMKIVPEATIDAVIEELNRSDAALEKADEEMAASQPELMAFLTQEAFDVLTEEEQDYLLLLGLTLWESARRTQGELPALSAEVIGEAEEANYALLEQAQGGNFRDRMDVFFRDFPQEDLLAFVEDALTDDEDDMVTPEGRETIFVTLKTVIDALHQSC
jgi:hypothetical protein